MSAVPSEKDRKYDRQLRLWASSGQKALEESHVCLLGATAIGSEITKNLVLPGIGHLTVIDDKAVTEDDLSNNFFHDLNSVGKSRAESVQLLLNELNPEVRSQFLVDSAESLASNESAEFWQQFSIVIACGIHPTTLEKISTILYNENIPLLIADTVGFYGYLRVTVKEHSSEYITHYIFEREGQVF